MYFFGAFEYRICAEFMLAKEAVNWITDIVGSTFGYEVLMRSAAIYSCAKFMEYNQHFYCKKKKIKANQLVRVISLSFPLFLQMIGT